MKFTLQQFQERFPDEGACLAELFKIRQRGRVRCVKCDSRKPYVRIKGRKGFQCTNCLNQIYPMAGTIFHGSSTPLTKWFLTAYLLATSKNGISAKQIERICGVSYPTALRMTHKIKELMANKAKLLSGIVQMDETMIGGKVSNMHAKKRYQMWENEDNNKEIVFGMVQDDGTVIARHVASRGADDLQPIIKKFTEKGSTIVSDALRSYRGMNDRYYHQIINHSEGEYAKDGMHTNTIENFWSHLKRGIKGTYIHVSRQYLQLYIDEAAFRYSHRKQDIFNVLFSRLASSA